MLILLPPSEKKAAEPGSAISVYTGVLYTALGWATLSKAAQSRGQRCIAIISAKYGVLKPLDEIAPYKEKINTAKMREQVTRELKGRDCQLIIDCRSSTYKGVWNPPHEKCVEIKIFMKVSGQKKVITHMSKKTRGEVTRFLLQTKSIPSTPEELCAILSTQFECELIPATKNSPWVLEVSSL